MNRSGFDSFLERIQQATGISSQADLAAALKITRSAITQARRKNAIPDKWILALYKRFGLNPEWVETGNGPTYIGRNDTQTSPFKRIPKVRARLCAGGGSFETGSEIEGYFAFQRDWLRRKGHINHMVLMDIFGNSMAPEMRDGDTVLIDESQKDILAGAIFAVGVDDTIMVKRVEKHPSRLVLLSDNKDYAPIYLESGETDSTRIIGKVVWVCREFR